MRHVGITDEGAEIMQKYKGSPTLDAGLLPAAQAVEHYGISRYGTLIAWRRNLASMTRSPCCRRHLRSDRRGSHRDRQNCDQSRGRSGVIRDAMR